MKKSKETLEPLACESCGLAGIHSRKVTRTYGKGSDLLVVENVPILSCPHCGVAYLTADALHEVERIKAHRRNLSKRKSISVADFVQPGSPGEVAEASGRRI